MPATGRRSPANAKHKPAYKAAMTALERYHRGARITAARAKTKPDSWATIAKREKLSQAGCQAAYARYLSQQTPVEDPFKVVDETIDVLTVAMHEALQNAADAPPGSTVVAQSLRVAKESALQRLDIMQRAGRAPRYLAAPTLQAQMQLMLREFAELLRRHEVPDAVLLDFLALAEGKMGQDTIEGRELAA